MQTQDLDLLCTLFCFSVTPLGPNAILQLTVMTIHTFFTVAPDTSENCTSNQIRLMGGTSEYDGRVEICVGGEWGTICRYSWGTEEARVVCAQLGYPHEGE